MAQPITTSDRRGTLPLAVVAALFAYGAVAALLPPREWPMGVATAVPIVAAVGLVVSRGWHRPRAPVAGPAGSYRHARAGAVVWILVIGAAVVYQLLIFFFTDDRHVYPTLSSLASQVFHIYPVRAAVFGLWLWFGWYLVDR